MVQSRYAVYYAPDPRSALWRFGSSVLGYDAQTGEECRLAAPSGYSEELWYRRTGDPRRYGFHATLKAPFRLRDGCRESGLLDQIDAFAQLHRAVEIKGLEVAALGAFIALIPRCDARGLERLAASAVTFFDAFRAPPTPEETAKRLQTPLSETQRRYLERWGYPYVMEQFRFHMTLTGALPAEEMATARAGLEDMYQSCVDDGPVTIGSVALYKQSAWDGRFHILHRATLMPALPSPLMAPPQREAALA